jgi:two-component system sensor histidine kinase BaeS
VTRTPLDQLTSVKVKLGVLVAVSVTVASVVAALGSGGGVPYWLSIPVTVALALGVTQLLAVGMTSPLREMTYAARRMARGDYSGRVTATSNDEVGELARTFNRMAEDLEAVDRQRRELIASVSHELRTPLAALCAVLENLVDGVGGPDPVALRTALDQAERLSALVSDLLDLARVEAGAVTLATSRLSVGDLLERSVAEARTTGRDVSYDVRVDPGDLTVDADPQRLQQLVANLLDNASRHSPAGGTVGVTATGERNGWRLEVSDDGLGIPAADRDRVFERFGTLDDGGGTGLGLAIARWVTDLHRGAIRFLDPDPGRTGARVRVDLPYAPDDPGDPDDHHEIEEPAMTHAAPPGPPATPTPQRTPVAAEQSMARPESTMDSLFGGFWLDKGLPGSATAVLGAVGAGVLAGIVLPYRDHGLGTFLVLLVCGAVVLAVGLHRRSAFTLACSGLGVLLASTLILRDAEWIVFLCVLAAAAVFVVGLVDARSLPGFVLAGIAWPLAALRGLPWLGRSLRPVAGLGRSVAAVRTALLSLLGVAVFGLLFASADALFAEWADAVVPDLEIDSFVLRAFLATFVAGVVLAAAYVAVNPPSVDPDAGPARPVARRYEWLVPVLLVDAVFLVFIGAQATVFFGGHDYLERTTGLTYAEYVHQGFGQLTAATALTLLVVWAAARKAPRATPSDLWWIRGSLGLLCALTLVVVASALYRMHVYQEAYGFTQLRLLVDVFEGWLGLLVVAVMVAGVTLRAAWLPRLALLTGAGALLGLALINPDAWTAERNLDRYTETGKIDWSYLQGLSADVVPALEGQTDEVVHCALQGQTVADDDWLEWNLGRHRAADEITANVSGRGPGEPVCISAD